MRRPTLTILLTDEAIAMYQRKWELSIVEISRYQDDLEALRKRLGAPLTVIRINGRDDEEIARAEVETIIETLRKSDYPMPLAASEPVPVTKRAS